MRSFTRATILLISIGSFPADSNGNKAKQTAEIILDNAFLPMEINL